MLILHKIFAVLLSFYLNIYIFYLFINHVKESQITKVFQEELNKQVISIIDKSKGMDQEVKIVQTNLEKLVLKKPRREKIKLLKEIVGTSLCSKKGIPVPKIIHSTDDYLIQTCIDGVDLEDLKTSKENFEIIYFQIGRLMKTMHSIKGKNFGLVNQNQLIGDYNSQKEAIFRWIPSEIERLEKLKYYSQEEIDKIKHYFTKNLALLATSESVFLHSDIRDANIVIKNNKVSGFIDFGDLSVGPAMQDFAFMYVDHFGDYKFQKLLEGYGEHNFEEIRFYAFCWLCWLVGSKIENKEFDKRFKRISTLFSEIWR